MTRRGLVLFGLMSLLWGIPYLFIRIAVAEISPAFLVFVRTAVGAAILLPAAIVTTDLGPVLRRWRWVVAFAVIEISIPWVTLGTAEQQVSSSLAGLLIAGVPLVGALIALLTGSVHRLSGAALLGLLVGLAGVTAIAGGGFAVSGITPLVLIGITVVGYAVGPVLLTRPLAGTSSVGIMGLSLTFNTVLYGVLSWLSGWPTQLPSTPVVLSVVILGVFSTAIAFLVFAELIKEIGPVRATIITYINPAVAAILGVVVLQETFTLAMIVGFALVIVGSILSTRRSGAASRERGPLPMEPS